MHKRYCSYVGETIPLSVNYLGRSSSRPKYFGDTFVIKFDETIRGPNHLGQQSTQEIRLWEILDEDRKYFAKLIDHSIEDGWVVQERIDIVRNIPTKDQRDIIERLKEKFGIIDILSIVMANWTVREDGIPVIYDWGVNSVAGFAGPRRRRGVDEWNSNN